MDELCLPAVLRVPPVADMHVHLRQGAMCAHVTRALPAAGVGTVLVMPNTVPPVATAADALRYRAELQRHAPNVRFLMTLYLTPAMLLDPAATVSAAVDAGCVYGVKYYPHGVTTNSTFGDVAKGASFVDTYAPLLAEMQKTRLVLNLHGECPGSAREDAEHAFLPTLVAIAAAFPALRITLEHATTRAAVELVAGGTLGPNVGCTVTAHHLLITADAWRSGNTHNYCKPVAKTNDDREALWEAVRSCDRVFLGSDSAPHPRAEKERGGAAADVAADAATSVPAGIYSGAYLLPVLAEAFEQRGLLQVLPDFVFHRARLFYGLDDQKPSVRIVKSAAASEIPRVITVDDGLEIVPFMAGAKLKWHLEFDEL